MQANTKQHFKKYNYRITIKWVIITEQQHDNDNDTQVIILTIGNNTKAINWVMNTGQQHHDDVGAANINNKNSN